MVGGGGVETCFVVVDRDINVTFVKFQKRTKTYTLSVLPLIKAEIPGTNKCIAMKFWLCSVSHT